MALTSLDDREREKKEIGKGGDPVCSPLERKGGVRLCLVSERNVNSRSWFVLEEGALLVTNFLFSFILLIFKKRKLNIFTFSLYIYLSKFVNYIYKKRKIRGFPPFLFC